MSEEDSEMNFETDPSLVSPEERGGGAERRGRGETFEEVQGKYERKVKELMQYRDEFDLPVGRSGDPLLNPAVMNLDLRNEMVRLDNQRRLEYRRKHGNWPREESFRQLNGRMGEMLNSAAMGGFLRDIVQGATSRLEGIDDWDRVDEVLDIYAAQAEEGAQIDKWAGHPEWKGMREMLVKGMKANAKARGLMTRRKATDREWLDERGYGRTRDEAQQTIREYRVEALAKYGDYLTVTPEELINKGQAEARRGQQEMEARRQAPEARPVQAVPVEPVRERGRERDSGFLTPEEYRRNFRYFEESGSKEKGKIEPDVMYVGLNEKERTEMMLRIRLANAREKKQTCYKVEKLGDMYTEFLNNFTQSELKELTGQARVGEAICIYMAGIDDPEWFDGITFTPAGQEPVEMENMLEAENSEDVMRRRRKMREYLQDRFRISREEAELSERVANNFVYMTHEAEQKDREGDADAREVAIAAMNTLMYPRDVLIREARKDKAVAFPNKLGTWAREHYKRRVAPRLRPLGPKDVPLPEQLLEGAMHKLGMYDDLVRQGRRLVEEAVDEATLDWDGVGSDKPFLKYYLGSLSPATKYCETVMKSKFPEDENREKMAGYYDKLGLGNEQRKLVEYLVLDRENHGDQNDPKRNTRDWINVHKRKFKPDRNRFWMRSFWKGFKKKYPGYLKREFALI